jgi:hypothetical protein
MPKVFGSLCATLTLVLVVAVAAPVNGLDLIEDTRLHLAAGNGGPQIETIVDTLGRVVQFDGSAS